MGGEEEQEEIENGFLFWKVIAQTFPYFYPVVVEARMSQQMGSVQWKDLVAVLAEALSKLKSSGKVHPKSDPRALLKRMDPRDHRYQVAPRRTGTAIWSSARHPEPILGEAGALLHGAQAVVVLGRKESSFRFRKAYAVPNCSPEILRSTLNAAVEALRMGS